MQRIDSTILIRTSAWLLPGLAVWPIKRLLRRAHSTPMASPLPRSATIDADDFFLRDFTSGIGPDRFAGL